PHPGALLGRRLDRLQPRLVDRHRQPLAAFGEDLGEAAAVGERAGEDALGDLRLDQPSARVAHARLRRALPATSTRRSAAAKRAIPSLLSIPWSAARPLA